MIVLVLVIVALVSALAFTYTVAYDRGHMRGRVDGFRAGFNMASTVERVKPKNIVVSPHATSAAVIPFSSRSKCQQLTASSVRSED